MNLPVGAKVTGIGAAVPESVVTNRDLEKLFNTSDEWITTRTGIRERRISKTENESATGLAVHAAREALEFGQVGPEKVDLVIVATSTPDFLYPSTACMVQGRVGALRAAAFDLEAACTGVIYAMSVAQQFIGSGTYRTVLIVGVDIHSRFIDWEDRNTAVLFGDGAGALVMEATPQNEILSTYLRADGSGCHLLTIPNTGTAYPHAGTTPPAAMHRFLQMNGRAIYNFAVNAVPEAVRSACARAGIGVDEIDFLVPHQANQRIIKAAAERLGMSAKQIVSNVEQYGNTSAASIPLVLSDALRRGQVVPPSNLALVGFGGGLTWGAAIVRWTACDRRQGLMGQ